MKCQACGYVESENYDIKKEFIESTLSVSYEVDNWPYSSIVNSTVYVCPDCGTLKIAID